MLKMRQRLLGSDTTPLLLFAPEQINSWLNYYDQNIETIKNQFHLISNGYLVNIYIIINYAFINFFVLWYYILSRQDSFCILLQQINQ